MYCLTKKEEQIINAIVALLDVRLGNHTDETEGVYNTMAIALVYNYGGFNAVMGNESVAVNYFCDMLDNDKNRYCVVPYDGAGRNLLPILFDHLESVIEWTNSRCCSLNFGELSFPVEEFDSDWLGQQQVYDFKEMLDISYSVSFYILAKYNEAE